MIICGSCMFEFGVSKNMKKKKKIIVSVRKGGGSREGSITFMYNTNCKGIKKFVLRQGRVVTTLNVM